MSVAVSAQTSFQGEWNLNEGASTKPPSIANAGGGRRGGDGPRGGAARPGPMGRGARGGAFGGPGSLGPDPNGGMPARGGGADGPAAQRLQEEMRNVTTPAKRLTVVQTDNLVVVTNEEGQSRRLVPDDKKVKNDAGVERRTKWGGGKLVSEISGLPNGTVTETYSVDDDTHRLHVVTALPNRQNPKEPILLDRVYDRSN